MTLQQNLKKFVWVGAIAFGFGVAGGGARAIASPVPQEHHDDMDHHDADRHEDYSKNRYYQQGMQDGRNDQMHNRDHYKRRRFKKDDDHSAYESGYQAGHGSGHDDHDRH
jgi:hypothetical protein